MAALRPWTSDSAPPMRSPSSRGTLIVAQLADRAPGWLERSLKCWVAGCQDRKQTCERDRTFAARHDDLQAPDTTAESIALQSQLPAVAASTQISQIQSLHRLLHSRWLAMGRRDRDSRAAPKPKSLTVDELFRLVRQELCVSRSICSDGDLWNLFKLLSYGKLGVTKREGYSRGRRTRRLSASSFVQAQRSILVAACSAFGDNTTRDEAAQRLVDALIGEARGQACMRASTLSETICRLIPCSEWAAQLLCLALQRSHEEPLRLDDFLAFILLSPAEIESLAKGGWDGGRPISPRTASERSRVHTCDDTADGATTMLTLLTTNVADQEEADRAAGSIRSFGDRKPLEPRPPVAMPYIVPSMRRKAVAKAPASTSARVASAGIPVAIREKLLPSEDNMAPNSTGSHCKPVVQRFWHFVRLTPTELRRCVLADGAGLHIMHLIEPQGSAGAAQLELAAVASGLLPLPLKATEHLCGPSNTTRSGADSERRRSEPPRVVRNCGRPSLQRFEIASTWWGARCNTHERAGPLSGPPAGSAPSLNDDTEQLSRDVHYDKTGLSLDADTVESQIDRLLRSRIEGGPVMGSQTARQVEDSDRDSEQRPRRHLDLAVWKQLMLARLT